MHLFNIIVLQHFQEQKETFCQRESQFVSKWPRKTRFGAKPGIPGGDKGQ